MTEEELHSKLYPGAAAKPEYIICAAIHFLTGIKHEHQPKNIESGFVICGRRHHNCYATWMLFSENDTKVRDVQGFLTSKDRFVDRKEAGWIAFAAAQSKLTDCLTSEDLY